MNEPDPFAKMPKSPGAIAQAIEKVRGSIVGIESAIGVGSGYCAMKNGVIATSQRVVGYEREVLITLEGGNAVPASVVRVNVALDIALLVPSEPIQLPPLKLSVETPRLGESVVLVGRAGSESVAAPTTLSSTERVIDGLAHMQVSLVPDPVLMGAALIDTAGHLLGSLVRPRRRSADEPLLSNLVLPIAAFEGGLLSVDGPIEEIAHLAPEYGCPKCDTVFEPGLDRCLECGILLPHPWADAPDPRERYRRELSGHIEGRDLKPERLALHAVRVALASLGIPANRARVGPLLWRFSPGPDHPEMQVDVAVDDSGEALVLRADVVRIPDGLYEPFYRHLLTLNDESAGTFRIGIRDGAVTMSAFEPVPSIDPATFPRRVALFVRALERYRESLGRFFGAETGESLA